MINIDESVCKACGICGDVCPRHIPYTVKEGDKKTTFISQERINLCMECGHCEAICPNGAITLETFGNEQFPTVEPLGIDESQFLELVKQRRSIRRYKNQPVPRESLNRIIQAARYSPTGTGRRTTGVIILDNPKTLEALSKIVYCNYEKLGNNLKNPIARFFIKRKIGLPLFSTLTQFVMPGMHWYLKWNKEGEGNEIFRDCPALILFHNPILEPMASENCLIAAFHAIFMAQILGIGSCFNDLIPPICNRDSEIREMLKLPKDREIYASITLGYPKYKFRRSIPKEFVEVRYLE